MKNISAKKLCSLLLLLPCAATSLYGASSSDTQKRNDSRQWYTVTFFSLKQGSSIRASQYLLHENNVFEFTIAGEDLQISKGSYAVNGSSFHATAAFSLRKKKTFQYILSLKGFEVFDSYAGTALLKEYGEGGRITQEISFLFFASKQAEGPDKKNNPFF